MSEERARVGGKPVAAACAGDGGDQLVVAEARPVAIELLDAGVDGLAVLGAGTLTVRPRGDVDAPGGADRLELPDDLVSRREHPP